MSASDDLSQHAVFYLFLSDGSKQDTSTTAAHIKCMMHVPGFGENNFYVMYKKPNIPSLLTELPSTTYENHS